MPETKKTNITYDLRVLTPEGEPYAEFRGVTLGAMEACRPAGRAWEPVGTEMGAGQAGRNVAVFRLLPVGQERDDVITAWSRIECAHAPHAQMHLSLRHGSGTVDLKSDRWCRHCGAFYDATAGAWTHPELRGVFA